MRRTHPDLEPERVSRASEELGLSAPRETPRRRPRSRVRGPGLFRRALRPFYARLADAVAARLREDDPMREELAAIDDDLRVLAVHVEMLRSQLDALRVPTESTRDPDPGGAAPG